MCFLCIFSSLVNLGVSTSAVNCLESKVQDTWWSGREIEPGTKISHLPCFVSLTVILKYKTMLLKLDILN